jgi:hypothetical protein
MRLDWPTSIAALALGFFVAAQSAAQPVLLGSSQFSELFSVDVTTGTASFIGAMPFGLATEIEFGGLTNRLFAEQTDGGTGLFTIDPASGAPLGVVNHAFGALNGLEFVGSTLYGTFIPMGGGGFPSRLVRVDTLTGALTSVGLTGQGPISGLAFDSSSGIMYGVTAGGGPAELVTIDLLTGAATVVGATGFDHIGSIEFASDGNLYGGLTFRASQFPNHLVQIDVRSGAAAVVGDTGFSITGLTAVNQAPDCSAAFADPDEIWAPNHDFHDVVVVGVIDPEGGPVEIVITQIAQDEPIEGRGDGNTEPDADGIGTGIANLRSERSALGDGRAYHVSFEAFDEEGASCEGTVTVCAPHDRGDGIVCVDQGALFDSITGLPLPQVIGPENGGFETGDFSGWGQINSGNGGIVIDDGTFDPPGPGGPIAPFAGGFSAATFQGGPGVHTLFQDVTLGASLLSARLFWADNLQNHAGVFADPIQEWRVEVWDPTDNSVLAELFSTNPGDPPIQAWTERTGDLSPWIGQTIRIAFTQQDSLYYFNARLDEVRIVGQLPLPMTLDIMPNLGPKFPNLIDPTGSGTVSVAILGSETFDVAEIDSATLAFGRNGAALVSAEFSDANGDGTRDLVSEYPIPATGIAFGDDSACISGATIDGEVIEGCDSLQTISCGIGFELALLVPVLMWLHGRKRIRLA